MRFFLFFRSFSFMPSVSFRFYPLSVCWDRLAPTLFHAFLSSLKRWTFAHQARVGAHEAIPSCLCAQLSSAMASSWVFSRPPFNPSPFPFSRNILRLEIPPLPLNTDFLRCGSGEFVLL